MQRRLRHACARVAAAAAGGSGGVEAVVKRATSASDAPADEKHAHELVKAFEVSGEASLRRFSMAVSRRLGRARSWRVALKCLLLLHRLVARSRASSPELGALFRAELSWCRATGLVSLTASRWSSSEACTSFVRSYSRFLDETLNNCTDDDHNGRRDRSDSFSEKVKEVGRVLDLLPQRQSLMDRVVECRPAGPASRSLVVRAAMKSVVRESFGVYAAFRREMVVVLESLVFLPYSSCVKAFGVYKKAGSQAERLLEFYGRCKEMGFCGVYEYPLVERIPGFQIRALESFFAAMWQFTDSEEEEESSSLTDEDQDKAVGCEKEEEPLIRFEDDDDDDDDDESWEALLEASVNGMSPFLNANGSCMSNGFCDHNMQMGVLLGHNVANPFNGTLMLQEDNNAYSRGLCCYGVCPSVNSKIVNLL